MTTSESPETSEVPIAQLALAGLQTPSEFDGMFGIDLYAHQTMALRKMTEQMLTNDSRSFGFFMEMGTGKTIIACASAVLLHEYWNDLVYIGPTKLRGGFFRTMKSLFRSYNRFVKSGGAKTIGELVFEPEEFDPLERAREDWRPVLHGKKKSVFFVSVNSQKLSRQLDALFAKTKKCLVVIDEAHLLSNRIYRHIGTSDHQILKTYNTLRRSPKLRIIQLTGTPFSNRVDSAIPLFNLLAKDTYTTLIPERNLDQMDAIVDSVFQKPFGLAQQLFESRMMNSFVAISTPWDDERLVRSAIIENPVDFVELSPIHREHYDSKRVSEVAAVTRARMIQFARGDDAPGGDYRTTTRQILNVYYPDDENKTLPKTEILEEIAEYAPKWAMILDRIMTKNTEIHAVHGHFINENGLGGFAKLLETRGFVRWNSTRDKLENRPYFAFATGAEDIDKLIETFNTEENYNASLSGNGIRVLLFSAAAATGMTFYSVKNVHIMGPLWKPSNRRQLIYRFSRIGSARYIPLAERQLNVYEYVAVREIPPKRLLNTSARLMGPDGNNADLDYIQDATTDFYMWRVMVDKGIENAVMQDALYAAATNSQESLLAENLEVSKRLGEGIVPPERIFTHSAADLELDGELVRPTWRSAFSAFSEKPNYGQPTDEIIKRSEIREFAKTQYLLDPQTGLVYGMPSSKAEDRDGVIVPFHHIRDHIYREFTNKSR